MKRTVTRLFNSSAKAHRVVEALEAAGIPLDDISLIENTADDWRHEGAPGGSIVSVRVRQSEVDGVLQIFAASASCVAGEARSFANRDTPAAAGQDDDGDCQDDCQGDWMSPGLTPRT